LEPTFSKSVIEAVTVFLIGGPMVFFEKKRIAALGFILGCLVLAPFSLSQNLSSMLDISSGAYLGISMENVTADNMLKHKLNSEKGVIVSSVKKGSPADEAALQENDVILEFGGFPVWSSSQLSRLVQETPIGRKVELVINRDGKRLNLSATLTRRDSNRDYDDRKGMLRVAPFQSNPYEFQIEPPIMEDRNVSSLNGKPRLGVTLQPLTDQLAEFLGVPGKKGVFITSVVKDSPSENKLRSGDVVVEADNKPMDTPEEFSRYIRNAPSGNITLKIIRDKEPATVVIDLPSDDNRKGYKL
jgi:serine protease Do